MALYKYVSVYIHVKKFAKVGQPQRTHSWTKNNTKSSESDFSDGSVCTNLEIHF